MAKYTQANRPLAVATPLDKDALLLEKFSGTEALSEPFSFRLDLLAEKAVAFDQLVGQPITVELHPPHASDPRYFHGIVGRLYQAGRVRAPEDATTFIRYRIDLVPQFWLLQKHIRSRIFHDLSVLEILQQVLKLEWQLTVSQAIANPSYFPKHNYHVQYQESDFHFASRLMEEAGLFYYFKHSSTGHEMVISDDSPSCSDLDSLASVKYDEVGGGARTEPRIHAWEKCQEVCPGKVTLTDYHFQLPSKDLSAQKSVLDKVAVGTVTHALNVANSQINVCRYPGAYASHFDSVDQSRLVNTSQRLDPIYQEKEYRARVCMEQAAAAALQVQGESDCGHFLPGFRFELARHFDANGKYLLTRVEHSVSLEGTYTAGQPSFIYHNRFACLPTDLPFRAASRTPRPMIASTQTAVVVGDSSADPPVDPYGRVKVQFHWDAPSPQNKARSCWVRVGQSWAGNRWGAFFWPRIGHEVIVAFENGDPDRPIIVGSVYNDDNKPPLDLPANASSAGIKSCSVGGNPLQNFCSFVFHDESGNEHLHLHSEKDAAHTSEAARVHRQPGRNLEIIGSFAVPSVGSGAGGGLGSDLCLSLEALGPGFADPFIDWYEGLFPGSYQMVCGSNTGITFMGTRTTHIIGGNEIKIACELFFFWELLCQYPILEKWLGGPPTKLSAALFGVSGDVTLSLGQKVSTTYFGPKYDIVRGVEEKFAYPGFGSAVGEWLKSLTALTILTTWAGSLWTYLNARFTSTVKDGKVSSPPAVAEMLSTTFTKRLHALVNQVEVVYGFADKANKKAKAAKATTDQARSLLGAMGMKFWQTDLQNLAFDYAEASKEAEETSQRVEQLDKAHAGITAPTLMKGAKAAQKAAEEKRDFLLKRFQQGCHQDYKGQYTLSADDINFISKAGTGINFLACADSSQIIAQATENILLTTGSQLIGMNHKQQEGIGKVDIYNGLDGTIRIRQGHEPDSPLIKLERRYLEEEGIGVNGPAPVLRIPYEVSIRLSVGDSNKGAPLIVLDGAEDSEEVRLQVGKGTEQSLLLLDATEGEEEIFIGFGEWRFQMNKSGITMKTQKAGLKLTPTDIYMWSVNTDLQADAQAVSKTVVQKVTVNGLQEVDVPLNELQGGA